MRNLSRTLLIQITALAGIAAVTAFSAFTSAEASEVNPGKPEVLLSLRRFRTGCG